MELDEPIALGVCRCPDTPHPDGDWVQLYAKLPLRAALAAKDVVYSARPEQEKTALVGEAFMAFGVAAWNLSNGTADAMPVTATNVLRELQWERGGFEVADRATDLYNEVFFAPLVARMSKSSAPGPTAPSTSAARKSRSGRRKR